MTAEVKPLLALEFLLRHSIWTLSQFVIQWTEQLFYKGVRILAFKKFGTLIPVAIIRHIWALVEKMEIKVWRSPKVLLSMSIIAFWPLMLLIYIWAKTSFIWVNHEFFQTHLLIMLVEILWKSLISHQIPHRSTLFGAERQRIYLLLLFIKWLNSIH